MAENLKAIKARLKAITEQIKASDSVSKKLQEELKILRELSKEARNLSAWESKRLGDLNSIGKFDKAAVQQMQAKSTIGKSIGKLLVEQVKMNTAAVKGELDINDVIDQKNSLWSQSLHLKTAEGKIGTDNATMTQAEIDASRDHIANMQKGLDVAMEVNATAEKRGELADELQEKLNFFQKGWDDIKQKIGDAWSIVKANPIKSVIGLLAAGVMAIGKHLIGIVNSSIGMQKELGVGAGYAMDLTIATKEAAAGGFMYGESMEDVAGRASTLVEEWGVINQETKDSISAANELERHYGVSTASAAQLAAMMESTSSSTKDVLLADMGKEMKTLQKQGIPVGKVMEEIAGDTDFFAGSMKKGGKNIFKAAAYAKRLGMNMSTVSGMADGLLDWDTSINAEMEASVLLGRNINMERARELAYAGDLEGMTKEIMKQVGSEAEFAEMSRVQREALAAAASVSLTDLSKMVAAEEKLANMSAIDLAKKKQNEAVTSNMQKIWGAITATLQKMYKTFITPMAEKFKEIMGISAGMSGEMEFGKDQIKALESFLTPIFEKFVSIVETVTEWIRSLGLARDENGKIVGDTFEFSNVLTLIKTKYKEIKESVEDWWEKNKKIVIGFGTLLLVIQAIPAVLALIAIATKAWAGLQWLLNIAMNANPIGAIILGVTAVIALVAALIYYWDDLQAWVGKTTGGVFDMWDILLLILGPLGWIIIAVKKIWENWGMISQVLVEVWEKVAGFFTGIGQYFAELWDGFEEKIAALGEYFVGIGEKIKGVFSGIGDFVAKIWEGLITIIKAPFNLIIAGINMMIRGVNSISIDIPDWVPDAFGGGSTFGFNIPEIPSLQTEVGEGHKIAAGGMAQVHGGESVGRFDFEPLRTELSETNTKLEKMIGLLSNMPTTDVASTWARKQRSATEGAFANR